MGQIDIYGREHNLQYLVDSAIGRLRFAAEQAQFRELGPLYLCFSGGKDSVVIYRLAEMAGVPFEAHYNITGVDPPEAYYFIRDQYPTVQRDMYSKSMWQLIVDKHMPPTKLVRYCCAELKEHGGEDRMCVTGVRKAESVKRSKRTAYEVIADKQSEKMLFNDNDEGRRWFEQCDMKRKLVCNPIIDWTDTDVWNFIHAENIPCCELYNQGWKRVGCIGCPMAPLWERKRQFERYPKFRDLYVNAFDRMLLNMQNPTSTWKTGEDVFRWWMYHKFKKQIEGQQVIVL